MAHRFRPIAHPVEIELDGEPIEAERGEPLAFALLAADRLVLGRSPKFHRPRGPTCLRGACDGCVMRVAGEPNVLTCMYPCRGGERLSVQNVLGASGIDLLQVTDWFFPEGLDHHHLFTRVPGSSAVLTSIARRMAGLGQLPDPPLHSGPGTSETAPAGRIAPQVCDAVVVGAGLAGLSVARTLATHGLRTFVFDDAPREGGSLRALDPTRASLLVAAARREGAHIVTGATVAGSYDRERGGDAASRLELLVVDANGARVVHPRALVLATGLHDGVRLFEGNDLPGVFSARAAALLALSGIAVGRRIALVGRGPYGDVLAQRVTGHADIVVRLDLDEPLSARGTLRVGALVARDTRHRVDALVIEAPGAPSFEIARQAGVSVHFAPSLGGYIPVVDENGRARADDGHLIEHLWCTGEVVGTGARFEDIERHADRVAHSIVRILSDGSPPSLNQL